MVDIKKVKEELLKEFGKSHPAPEKVAKDDPIDTILTQYFNKLSHMPKELILDAITNTLKSAEDTIKEIDSKKVKKVLDKFKS